MRRLPPRSNRTAPPVTYTTLFRSNAVETAHVGPQSLRNGNRAIGVLIILDHGDQRPADREAGAVERMHEACPLLARRAKPGLHAPRLKIPTVGAARNLAIRSEEHTSELQSLMRISYAVFCLKKKNQKIFKRVLLAQTKRHQHTDITTYISACGTY